jgi:hypothetical protein
MNFFGVSDPYVAWALLTFLALPPLLLGVYVAFRLIARRNDAARWEDARRELEGGKISAFMGRRWIEGRWRGARVILESHRRLTGEWAARITVLREGLPPIFRPVSPRDFPPRDLARRLDALLAARETP